MQTKIYTIFLVCYLISLGLYNLGAQELLDKIKPANSTKPNTTKSKKSKPVDSDSISSNFAFTEKLQDTVRKDTVIQTSDVLTDNVKYTAQDYMRLSRVENKMYLYNKAKIIYGDIQLEAGIIVLDNNKNEVYAFGIEDSLGNYSQAPIFKQSQNIVKPDSIRFNFKTEKALIYNSRTKQGETNIKGEVSKRVNDSVIYMSNVKITTSTDVDNPEYYFYARRIKLVPKKKIVSGLVNMYIADVPTPLGLPFGFFPLTEDRTSGFIIPSYGEENTRGYFLQNGGYYFAINDYMDLTVLGDWYTNGSYALRADVNYALRYRFRAFFNVRYEKFLTSERGFPDFSKRTIFNIQWNHNQDAKANPNNVFTANVNFGSTDFFTQSTNQLNAASQLNNTLRSAINFTKTIPGNPRVTLTLNANHESNSNSESVNLTLPNAALSVSRIYPFAPKSGTKRGLLQNINLTYTYNGSQQITTTDEDLFSSNIFKNAEIAMTHDVPINTNIKLFKYINASFGTNYRETWVFETTKQRYDNTVNSGAGGVVRDTIKGFDAFRSYDFSTGLSTTLYGMVNFKKDKKIQAIRHTISPSINFSLNPSFSQFYDTYTQPVLDNPATPVVETEEVVTYSRFEGQSPPGRTLSSSIGISVNNNIEAKVKDSDTTATKLKKIKIINNLSLSTSYNLISDSLKLSPISVSGSLPILQNKLDINFNAILDIYALDNSNRRIDKLNINNGGSLFRLEGGGINFGYSFTSKMFEKKEKNKANPITNENFRNGGRPDDLFGGTNNLANEEPFDGDKNQGEFKNYAYKIPWSLRLSYTMNYSNSQRQNEITSHTINFSGDLSLAPRWKIGLSSGYDIRNPGITFTNLRFQRDLESWQMSFNWNPIGINSFWSFYVGIKSSVFRDIKYDKRRPLNRSF